MVLGMLKVENIYKVKKKKVSIKISFNACSRSEPSDKLKTAKF